MGYQSSERKIRPLPKRKDDTVSEIKSIVKKQKKLETVHKKTKHKSLASKSSLKRKSIEAQDKVIDLATARAKKEVEKTGSRRILTKELVNIIFGFCELYSGITLFPYQAQFAKRIIRSILENDGDEISALFSRQSGKSETVSIITGGLAIMLPILASMPMFVLDERLKPFVHGIIIGIFAPSLHQAQIVFGRSKKRMGSAAAQEVMSDPEVDVTFETSNGQNVVLSTGSVISCQSASDNANIEGDSYHLIIVDESQDVGNFKYRKSISPMGAFYNATKILIGTATMSKGFFYQSIKRNEEEYKDNPKKRNHFQYDWTTIVKYNKKYAKYIEGEKKRLGEKSDEFRMAYCLEWILARGMFITDIEFEGLKSDKLDFSRGSVATCVAGIDLAKTKDATVVSIGVVDFDNPTILEHTVNNKVETYEAFSVDLIAFYDLSGNNYEQQYYELLEILNRYNIVKVAMDATGVGSPIFDRLSANTKYDIEAVVYSRPSKSALYKHFSAEITGHRLTVPMYCNDVVDDYIYAKFEREMLDLQKSHVGQYLVCSHPDENGAHDDYPDSISLMLWAAKNRPKGKITFSNNSPYTANKAKSKYYNARNKHTSRRAS